LSSLSYTGLYQKVIVCSTLLGVDTATFSVLLLCIPLAKKLQEVFCGTTVIMGLTAFQMTLFDDLICLQDLEDELFLRFENWCKGEGRGAGTSDMEASLGASPAFVPTELKTTSSATATGVLLTQIARSKG
jgi:hypothetical protein